MDSVEIARVQLWSKLRLPGSGCGLIEIARCPVVDSVEIARAWL